MFPVIDGPMSESWSVRVLVRVRTLGSPGFRAPRNQVIVACKSRDDRARSRGHLGYGLNDISLSRPCVLAALREQRCLAACRMRLSPDSCRGSRCRTT